MRKIGFIGYGNMGKMIINNILDLNLFSSNEMIVSNRTISKINGLKSKYPEIAITDDNKYLSKNCDKIFIFVETPEFKKLILEISPFLNDKSHVIHVCAGLSFDNIANVYEGSVSQVIPSIISTLTNTREKLGISLISHNEKTEVNDKEFVEELFNEFSYIELIGDENGCNCNNNNNHNHCKDLEIATILTSCGPAFISLIIKKLANMINLKSDFSISVEEAENLIVKTLIGTSTQIDTRNLAIDDIINKTATKKGITSIGLNYLEDNIDSTCDELLDTLLKRYVDVKKDLYYSY